MKVPLQYAVEMQAIKPNGQQRKIKQEEFGRQAAERIKPFLFTQLFMPPHQPPAERQINQAAQKAAHGNIKTHLALQKILHRLISMRIQPLSLRRPP